MPRRHILWLIKHYAIKKYGGVEVFFHIFLSLALNGGEQSALCLDCFTPEKRAYDNHLIGDWPGRPQS
jgi:hypothetical protein